MFLGEQPPSSMSPIVLKSPLRTLVIGSTGATMITTSIASVGIHDNHTRGCQQTDPPCVFLSGPHEPPVVPEESEGINRHSRHVRRLPGWVDLWTHIWQGFTPNRFLWTATSVRLRPNVFVFLIRIWSKRWKLSDTNKDVPEGSTTWPTPWRQWAAACTPCPTPGNWAKQPVTK